MAAATAVADAAIVGTAIVRRMGEAGDPDAAVASAAAFVSELGASLARREAS